MSNPSRVGFSLIEMMAVLTIAGIIAATVSVRWSGVYRAALFRSDVENIIDFDNRLRQHLKQQKKVGALNYNSKNGVFTASRWVGDKETWITLSLQSTASVVSIFGAERSGSGNDSITIDQQGASSSYLVELANGNKTLWILITGRTGQPEIIEAEIDASNRKKLLEAIGNNAY